MNNEPSSHVSALFDGELEAHEAAAGLRDISDNGARWREYALIGDGLRGERTFLACDISTGVMAQLSAQPVVLAPRNLQTRARKPHPLLALAASAAGVAVVGWLAFVDGAQPSSVGTSALTRQLDRAATATLAVPPAPTIAPPAQVAHAGDLTEYLVAHRVQASLLHLGERSRPIRPVTLESRPGNAASHASERTSRVRGVRQDEPWLFSAIPSGFRRQATYFRNAGQGENRVGRHWVFTDGLKACSVFATPLPDGADGGEEGERSYGSLGVVTRVLDGHQIHVVGELPLRELGHFAEGIVVRAK